MSITLPHLPPPPGSEDHGFRFTVPLPEPAREPLEERRAEPPWQGITAGWLAGAAEAVG